MSELEKVEYNTTKSLETLVKISSTGKAIMIPNALPFGSVKRLIDVDEDEIHPAENSDDLLGEELVEAAFDLEYTERIGSSEITVSPANSLAALFDRHSAEAKLLKPRLWCAWDVSSTPKISGLLVACTWTTDETLGTERFTSQFNHAHGIPRLTTSTLFVDVVASRGVQSTGALLLLSAYLLVSRSRTLDAICTIAVTKKGRSLCEKLGFSSYNFKQGGIQKSLCWAKSGTLLASDINKRLRLSSRVPDVCWRSGYTERTAHKKYPRC